MPDRHGAFQPQIVEKHKTRWAGFDDKNVSLYVCGMTAREILAHMQEVCGAEALPGLVSSVIDVVADEIRAWRPHQGARRRQVLVVGSLRNRGVQGFLGIVEVALHASAQRYIVRMAERSLN